MPGIAQNTTYDNASTAMNSMVSKLSAISKNMPRQKKVAADTSKYGGLVDNVKSNLGAVGPITTPYGGQTKFEAQHLATDYGAPMGTPVPAYAGGKVVDARTGTTQGSSGFGNYVIIETPTGEKFRYSHLSRTYVPVGTIIQPGEIIGAVGNSGSTYSSSGKGDGSHLDLRIQDLWGKYINPSQYVSG